MMTDAVAEKPLQQPEFALADLRFVERLVREAHPRGGFETTTRRILQQKWHVANGIFEWRDVPLEEE